MQRLTLTLTDEAGVTTRHTILIVPGAAGTEPSVFIDGLYFPEKVR